MQVDSDDGNDASYASVEDAIVASWQSQSTNAADNNDELPGRYLRSPAPSPHPEVQVKPAPSPHSAVQHTSNTEPSLCREQEDLVDLIASGRNVFYTGSAGCGKSTVLKAAVKTLHKMGKHVQIVAPTGRAALQVNGMSTWSFMGWTPDYHKLTLSELAHKGFRKHVKARIDTTDVLIIDEISMVENHHFERMNHCMKAVRCWSALDHRPRVDAPAFGGVQLVVTGDFCQLPPVKPFQFCMECCLEMTINDADTELDCPNGHGPFPETDKWAFKSAAWQEAGFVHVNLQEIHRQSDETFIRMLQKCRLGLRLSEDELETLTNHECRVHNATRLLCTRAEVTKVNRDRFNRMVTPKVHYKALDGFAWNSDLHPQLRHYDRRAMDDTLEACKDHRLEPLLQLRAGMLIVLEVNLDLKLGLVNGSQGIICGWEDFDPAKLPKAYDKSLDMKDNRPNSIIGGDYAKLKEKQIREFMNRNPGAGKWPRVHFHNGLKRTIYPTCVVNSVGDREPYSLLYRTQIPLAAGWALSVHKSQGMTLDRVIVNLSRAFEEGQVYVALSRATSLEGLMIKGDVDGLTANSGGNADVREFLMARFGEKLFLDHGGLPTESISPQSSY